MGQFLSTETLIIELLLIVSLVAIGVRRLHIPYMVTLLVIGQKLEVVPTVIHEQAALIETGKEFIRRLGMKPAIRLMLGLPNDREPTPYDFRAIPPGRTIVIFKIVGHTS